MIAITTKSSINVKGFHPAMGVFPVVFPFFIISSSFESLTFYSVHGIL